MLMNGQIEKREAGGKGEEGAGIEKATSENLQCIHFVMTVFRMFILHVEHCRRVMHLSTSSLSWASLELELPPYAFSVTLALVASFSASFLARTRDSSCFRRSARCRSSVCSCSMYSARIYRCSVGLMSENLDRGLKKVMKTHVFRTFPLALGPCLPRCSIVFELS